MRFTDWVIPAVISGVFLYGLCRGLDVFSCFIEGAKQGLQTAADILPALVCLLVAVSLFRAGGCLELLTHFLRPVVERIGFPAEAVPLALLRPVSGSGSLALLSDLLQQYGPDSFIGRVASVLQGAGETTFYAVTVYYGSVGIRRTRHTLAASLTADAAGALLAAFSVRLLLGE